MNFLKLWLLGLVSERLDNIIALVDKLDTRLDRYIETQATLHGLNQAKIEKLTARNEAIDNQLERAVVTKANIRRLTGVE